MHVLRKQATFEAAHFLPLVAPGHKCASMHGHSYVIEVGVVGELTDQGWVMDFGDISTALKQVLGRLDHRTLNDVEGLENPTSEVLAQWIHEFLAQRLPDLA